MTQPTFALPCEYGLEVTRRSYGQRIKLAAASGTASPSTDELGVSAYEITTVPIDNDIANSLDAQLQALKGSYFYSQFYFDDQQYKYRIVDDEWTWRVIGPTANIFVINVERLYEPTVEFAIDYQVNQTQNILKNFLKIGGTSGQGTPSIETATIKRSQITTRPLSKVSAQAIISIIEDRAGTVFFSQLYLDSTPKRYRFVDGSWSISSEGEDSCSISFELEEVVATSDDIPIAISPTSSKRSNYGQLIKIASTSGTATPSGTKPTIRQYSITTAALNPSEASGVTSDLEGIAGSFFYGKIFDDASEKKYCLVDDEWTQEFSSKDGVVFQFDIREVYEPSLEFAIDYGQSQEQSVSAHVFRIASSSGTATPSITSKSIKTASVKTRPMSLAAARGLETILLNLNGDSFYSKIYLDNTPRAYRLQPNQWSWTPEGEDMYSCSFTMTEVLANSTDIPCVASLNLERRTRIKKVQFGDGYEQNAPDGVNVQDYIYSIETLPLSDTQAASVESSLSNLEGDFFYAKFTNDSQVYKYRLDGSTWTWRSDGPESNVFVFKVKRAYDL